MKKFKLSGRSRFVLMLALCSVFCCLLSAVSFADIPKIINVQGKLNNITTGAVNGSKSVKFMVMEKPNTLLWISNPMSVDFKDGIFSANLDLNKLDDQNLSSPELLLFDKPYSLGIIVDGVSVSQDFTAVPYALNAEKFNGLPLTSFVTKDAYGSVIGAVGNYVKLTGDTMSGGLSATSSNDNTLVGGIAGYNSATWGRILVQPGANAVNAQGTLGFYDSPSKGVKRYYGVYGSAVDYGVYGETTNPNSGIGVYGNGNALGGSFASSGSGGFGIKAQALADGQGGVIGLDKSEIMPSYSQGYGSEFQNFGVYGGGANVGVAGKSKTGIGVVGHSQSGAGIVGVGLPGVSGKKYLDNTTYGELGTTAYYAAVYPPMGVYGSSTDIGVYGGVGGSSKVMNKFAHNGIAVIGEFPDGRWHVEDGTIGVAGWSPNGRGVSGGSTQGVGVFGVSSGNDGVQGYASGSDKAGVYGLSINGYGVWGHSNSGYDAGVKASNNGGGPALEIGDYGWIKIPSGIDITGQSVITIDKLSGIVKMPNSPGTSVVTIHNKYVTANSIIILTVQDTDSATPVVTAYNFSGKYGVQPGFNIGCSQNSRKVGFLVINQ